MKLFEGKPARLFTFGCSFTDYHWATWANILALDLDCEFYNFGKSGSGNFLMSNLITQADAIYKFNQNDLIIVCWTNISREDRWLDGRKWITPGNIYSQGVYDEKFVKKWACSNFYSLRDFSQITLIDNFLYNKTQYHFLSMCNITEVTDQWSTEDSDISKDVKQLFEPSLSKILPSFYKVLWDDDIQNKLKKDEVEIHPKFFDGHPTILEHLEYLQKSFTYEFSPSTIKTVEHYHRKFLQMINKDYVKYHIKDTLALSIYRKELKIKNSDCIDKRIFFK